MKLIVYNIQNKECMIQRCSECPCTDEPLVKHLQEMIGEGEDDEMIHFSQWTTTDRSTMIQQEKIPDYFHLVVSQIHRLTFHSYIAKCQTRNLQQRKDQIDSFVALHLEILLRTTNL